MECASPSPGMSSGVLPKAVGPWLLGLAALQTGAPLVAAEAELGVRDPSSTRTQYALGLAAITRPSHAGGRDQTLVLRPLWALRHGRFRLSGPRSGGLLGTVGDEASGASADLVDTPQLALRLGLSIDSGRRSGDAPELQGLPDIRRTLRGKLSVSRNWHDDWSASLSLSPDLLGRGGGRWLAVDLGRHWHLQSSWLAGWQLSAGAGLTWGDARAMDTQFGIADAVAQRTGRPAYRPGSGLRDWHLGLGLQRPLSRHWMGFGQLGWSTLVGDAAASPLTLRRHGLTLSLGLAWRQP